MQAFLKSGKLGIQSGVSKDIKSGSSGTKKKSASVPWVEKYRPRTVDDVVEQGEVVQVLRQCLDGADLPNLLFYGPPGTGKTSTILAAAKQLFGNIYKDRILELNASDERGIDVIRDKVKTFAQLTASGIRPDGQPCPAFKIIILDEADSMTHAAQAALRRTIEREAKTTRFCLICNYVSRIIKPLTSRCSKFRFKPLGQDKIVERLKYICSEENVLCEDDILHCLVKTCNGDLRRAITSLQSCTRLKGKDVEITTDDVFEVTGVVPNSWVEGFLQVCQSTNYDKVVEFINNLMLEAYSSSQILEQIHELIVLNKGLTDKQKTTICDKLGLCAYRMQDGANETIGLLDLSCALMSAYKQQ